MSKPDGTRRRVRFPYLVAAAVVVALLVPVVSWANHDFNDVPTSSPFHDEISWMADTNITTGFPGDLFKPGEPVSRQAMAAFMQRLYDIQAGLENNVTGTDGGSADANTATWQNVTDGSVAVTVPPGTTGRIVTTFAGDAFCNSGDNIFVFVLVVKPQCLGRISITNGAGVSLPDEVSLLDSDDAAAGDAPDPFIDSEGFSMTATSVSLDPGTYTVRAQINTADSNPATDPVAFELNDFIVSATVVLDDAPEPVS
jgi:hypothetical protein